MKIISRVNINSFIEKNHITKRQLANDIDFSEKMLSRVLNYDAPMSRVLRRKLTEYFRRLDANKKASEFLNEYNTCN